jgi:general secretion pathway protein G
MVAKGFTLVEILIVVVILGILAAIVIPQFTNASESAKYSNLTSQLSTIRSQIALYQNQHNDAYPDLSSNWNQLIQFSNVNGGDLAGSADSSATPPRIYGPYLQKVPVNPFTDSSAVSGTPTSDGTASASVGWVWDGGILKAALDATKAGELDADTTNDVVTY